MSYSGNTTFDFDIERYKDRDSGNLVVPQPSNGWGDDFEHEYTTITLVVEGHSSFTAGKYFGPPENSYPDEGEISILSVIGPDGKDWEDKLTAEERESILNIIDENVMNDGPDPDDHYDERD